MKRFLSVYDLERLALPPERWHVIPRCVETALGQSVEEASSEVPLCVGHLEITGWFIVMSGQGPFIFWMEKEENGTYGYATDGRRDHWYPEENA